MSSGKRWRTRSLKLDKLEYWKLCTEFTVVQAALIVCGIAPEDMQFQVERTNDALCPEGYVATRTALKHALESGRIKPARLTSGADDEGNSFEYVDVSSTTISVDEIDRFLKLSGMYCEFFDRRDFQQAADVSADPAMPFKLAAALKAWKAVTSDPARLRGKSPKQALEQWLVENAADLGLLKRDGQPNRTGIDEICKVANWKPAGGATPTPTPAPPVVPPVAPKPLIRLPPPSEDYSANLDDEIPF